MKQQKPGSKPSSAKGESRVPEESKVIVLWKPDVALRRMGGVVAAAEAACMAGKLNEAMRLFPTLTEKTTQLSQELMNWQHQQAKAH